MTVNMTIEEAKKALQKEAKTIRKQLDISGDYLKVSCNIKQMMNGNFTIFSRNMQKYEKAMMELGNQFGTFIGVESDKWGARARFKFHAMELGEGVTKPKEKSVTKDQQAPTYKKMTQKMFDAMNEARVNMRIRYDLGPQIVEFIHEKCHREQFVIVLHNTDPQHGFVMLDAFKHLGQIVEMNAYDTCVEYIFQTHDASCRRPAITMDLRGLPCPEDLKNSGETIEEACESTKPLAEAKKDILKFADKLRKRHGIPGSDFRIICTETHIAIGEFILYAKDGYDDECLRSEFDQFGRCYKSESAGKGATRFRFYYKGTRGYLE